MRTLLKYYWEMPTGRIVGQSSLWNLSVLRYWGQSHMAIPKWYVSYSPEAAQVRQFGALHHVAYYGHEDIARLLVAWNPDMVKDVDAFKSQTALHLAVIRGHVGVVRVLIEADPSLVHALDYRSNTALGYAEVNQHVEIVNLLSEMRM
eukprot:PhF_6_TR8519/c0_g1_i3/m.13341